MKRWFGPGFWKRTGLFLGAVFLGLAAGCGKKQPKELKLVTEPPYPPFEYYVGEKLTGIDIDIMREIASRLGYDLKIQPISFEMVIKSVAAGRADVGISCISITEERRKQVDFSIPYVKVGQMVVVPAESSIRRFENLPGKVIGAQADTTGEAYVREKFGSAAAYPNIEIAEEALKSGKIDALVLDSIPAEAIVVKNPAFRLLPGKLTEEAYGIAVDKRQPELREKINGCLADMLKTGWIEKAVKRHVNHLARPQEPLQHVPQLKIGIVPSYPPYEAKENGEFKGIDVDIIHRICDEIGCVPLFVELGSDTIYQAIAEDDVTVAISSITITEERKKTVDFSIPYSGCTQRILVKKQSPFRMKKDLKGKPIGVVHGTTSEEQGLLLSGELERYSEPKLMLEALIRDEVAAIVLDDFILKQLVRHSDEFRMLPDVLAEEKYGIAVSKKQPELLKKIDRVLLKMKQEGSLGRIHEKHFSEKFRSSR